MPLASTHPLYKYLWVIAFSFVGSFGMTYFTCNRCHYEALAYVWVSMFSFTIWVSLWIGNDYITHYFNDLISWVKFPLKRMIVGIVSTVVFTALDVLLIDYLWRKLAPFEIGDDYYMVLFALVITFLISLFLHSREFLIRWKLSAVESERHQKESVKAQYESLKNQVNPHFLFNSLNALTNLVYEDQDKAAMFIKQLSEVYRYVLDTRDKEVVSLQEELKFIDSYLFLQNIRFGDKLKVDIKLSNVTTAVAPLALQTLLENAIKHNVISQEYPLTLELYSDDSFISVENVIRKKNVMEDSTGLGLDNIKKRYEFLTDTNVSVSDENGRFIVRLPLLPLPV